MSPTRRTALAIGVVAVLALVLQRAWGVALALGAALLGAVIADGLAARRRRIEVSRTRLGAIARGSEVAFDVDVSTSGTGSLRLHQPMPPEISLEPADSRGDLHAKLHGRHRGTHIVPATALRVYGPLGLASRDLSAGTPIEAVVMPDLPRARRMAEARARGRLAETGRLRSRLGIGTEFETVRDYTPDDDVRQINWTATQRVGRPMSNQYRVDENRDLVCLVDSGRLMAAPLGSATRMDVALDALTALAVAAEEAGDRVGVIAFGETVLRDLPPRRMAAQRIVRTLFDLEPTEVDSDYAFAFTAAGRAKRSLVTLFTDLMDESATSSLIEALPVLVRKHAVMAVSCVDTDLIRLVREPPQGVSDALRQSTAFDLLSASTRSADLLKKMGATVVVAEPENLGSACVDGYLRLKRRARI